MDQIKTVLKFKSIENIDDIIENWMEKTAFKESMLPEQLICDDVTYCFSLDKGDAKTLLTINILDGNVHLEAWTLKKIDNDYLSKASINDLLKMLGQDSIN